MFKNLPLKIRYLLLFVIFAGVQLSGIPGVGLAAPATLKGFNVTSDVTLSDIDDLETITGAKAVRYQLIWHGAADIADEASYFEWLNGALNQFDIALQQFKQKGIKVVLNLHTPPGGFSSYSKPFPQMRVFAEKWAQDALIKVWDLIANRYKDEDGIYAFQILSEPAVGAKTSKGLKKWSNLSLFLAKAIRKIDKRHAIVTSPEYANPQKLQKLKFHRGVRNVIYAIHSYTPVDYVKQGIEGYQKQISYSPKIAKRLIKHLRPARVFQQQYRAKIMVTEFGVVRWADGAGQFLDDILKIFNGYRWSWMYHIWREADVWSIEYDDDISSRSIKLENNSRLISLKKHL